MKSYSVFCKALMVFLFFAFLLGCKKKEEPEPAPAVITIPTETRTGQLLTVSGSAATPDDFNAFSMVAFSGVQSNGSFTVTSVQADRFQMIFFLDKTSKKPCYIGLYNPTDGVMEADLTSTAKALLLFTPNLFYTTQAQRSEYLEEASQNPKFEQLKELIRLELIENAIEALDFEKNPTIYQLSAELMKETMESLAKDKKQFLFGGDPSIEDLAGPEISIINPRHVYYGTGIYPNDLALSATVTANRQQSIVGFEWGWPPVTWNEPEQTNVSLGDGYYRLLLHKGFDFSDPQAAFSWDNPIGRGTICNSGEALLQVLDLIIGYIPKLPLQTLPQYLHVSTAHGYNFYRALSAGDPLQFLQAFMEWLIDNKEGIAYWFFQEGSNVATHEFINNIAGILKNVSLAMKFLNFANGGGPFFYDLIFAPSSLNFYITQQNGVIINSELNSPPIPKFTISPQAGISTTNFQFDATESSDDKTAPGNLQFRWDFESDGTWDTPWENDPASSHVYGVSGSFNVTLSVQDESGLVAYLSHKVNIGGGAGSAKHIKLFMDEYPWNSTAMITMLEELGFSTGTGEDNYEIFSSNEMAGVELIPGDDLVILCNDQPQEFYNNYSMNQVKFSSFVYSGGSMLWEACDEGWNNGSMSAAGMTLPGNIQVQLHIDNYNYVSDPQLPLVAGLPETMDHNYASHENFVNLPEGTTIYCHDSDGKPTLVECNLGDGWIVLSGQPLEHQYDHIYGAPDMEQLLPRIVSYFTGKSWNDHAALKNRLPVPSLRPSLGENKRE